jgi:hypothetical protein
MSSEGVMPSKKANNHPALRPIKGHQRGLGGNTRARDELLSLSQSASQNPPLYQVLSIQPALNFSSYTQP